MAMPSNQCRRSSAFPGARPVQTERRAEPQALIQMPDDQLPPKRASFQNIHATQLLRRRLKFRQINAERNYFEISLAQAQVQQIPLEQMNLPPAPVRRGKRRGGGMVSGDMGFDGSVQPVEILKHPSIGFECDCRIGNRHRPLQRFVQGTGM